MIDRLEDTISAVSSLNAKLILIIGPPQSGKSRLLDQLSDRRGAPILNVGRTLGQKLLAIPSTRRPLQATEILSDIADEYTHRDLLLLDNIELLFDRTLQLDPLDLLKRRAHARRVIAVWPGELQDRRLSYAATGHSEHQNYGVDGLVPFEIH